MTVTWELAPVPDKVRFLLAPARRVPDAACWLLQVTVAPGAVPCAGPGCSEAARPDTVYCSNDCILRHAAAAVRSLRARKELRPKPEKKVKTQAEKLQLPKPRVQVSRPR